MTDKKVIDIQAARSKRKPSKKEKRKRDKAIRKEKKAQLSPRMRKKKTRNTVAIALLVMVLCVFIGCKAYKIISLEVDNNRLQKEQEKLIKERDEKKQDAKNVNSLDYIEQQARLKLHLVLPGEILYVLPEEEQADEN